MHLNILFQTFVLSIRRMETAKSVRESSVGIDVANDFWAKEYQRNRRRTEKIFQRLTNALKGEVVYETTCALCGHYRDACQCRFFMESKALESYAE